MTKKTEWLFWTLVWEIFQNNSPAVSNIKWRLKALLDDLGLKEVRWVERKGDGQRSYFELYSSKSSQRAIGRIYKPCDQDETKRTTTITNPYRGGRVSKVPFGTRERVKQCAADGCSEREIVKNTGLSRKQVRHILGRS